MIAKQPYTFTVLRYVHDIVTGEFVNVGVVARNTATGAVGSKFRTSMGRVKAAFPGLTRASFVMAMQSMRRGLKALEKDSVHSGLLEDNSDAGAWARKALPADDSALQWSPVGSGVTDNLTATLDRLYERFVTKNDLHIEYRNRSDEDVWRPVRQQLAERNVDVPLQEKIIAGATDRIVFKKAWKNGIWHAYEPISFDLTDEQGIRDKARRWRGHLEAVAEGVTEKVKLNFVLGAPSNPDLAGAYGAAIAILQHAPFDPQIYGDGRIRELVDSIEDEVRAHERASD